LRSRSCQENFESATPANLPSLHARHAARLMLGFLFGSSASADDRKTIERKCGARSTAVKQCLLANPNGPAWACDAFAQDLDLCRGRVVCADAARAFDRCAHSVVNHKGVKADTPDCGGALKKLRACLRRKRVA
jgi:hypothetical protein